LHAPGDELVAIDNARRIFDTAKHPKSFVSLDDADHLLTRGTDAAYVAEVLAAWVGRYLAAPLQREPAVPPRGRSSLPTHLGACWRRRSGRDGTCSSPTSR
jgi:putative redox protein